jgi:hypothetical protein
MPAFVALSTGLCRVGLGSQAVALPTAQRDATMTVATTTYGNRLHTPSSPTSPTNRLCRKDSDLAVLVDGEHESLLRQAMREPPQHEIQPVPAHDYSLATASRLDVEALRRSPLDISIECG